MNLFLFVRYILWIIKLLVKTPDILVSNVSNGNPCHLFIFLTFGPKNQRRSHTLTWSSHIIPWLWRSKSPLVQKIKPQRNVQGDILFSIIDFPVFINIAPSKTCHVHWCGLIFPWRLPSGSTMINSWWWCYNCWELHVHVTTVTV